MLFFLNINNAIHVLIITIIIYIYNDVKLFIIIFINVLLNTFI